MTISVQVPPDEPRYADVEIREILATVVRRKWLILAVTVIFLGLTAVYTFTRVPTYAAQAVVLVKPILVNSFEMDPRSQISMETEAELVASGVIAAAAAEVAGPIEDFDDLAENLSVNAPEESQILEITVSDRNPIRAQRGAQAFAEAYLRFKSEQAITTIEQNAEALRDEIAQINREIAQINRDLALVARDSVEWKDLTDRRAGLNTSRLALENQLPTIAILSTDAGQIVRPAEVPTSPTSPNKRLNLLVGGIFGLLIGLGVAFLMEQLSGRVETAAELELILGAPTLGVIPRAASLRRRSARLAMIEVPSGPTAEAYRGLRTNILAVSQRLEVKSLLVTSAGIGEGKSTIAANLSVALAQAGRSVVLISGDLHRPSLHTLFGIGNERGLTQVLGEFVSLEKALTDTDTEGLKLLPSGPLTELDGSALLQSYGMRNVLERCSNADFVVIDGPPISFVADSLSLGQLVDGILLVVDAMKSTRAAVLRTQQQLGPLDARVLGGVVNRVRRAVPTYIGKSQVVPS